MDIGTDRSGGTAVLAVLAGPEMLCSEHADVVKA